MSRAIRHAFVIRDRALVSPFDAPAGDAWLIDRTVRDHARATLTAAGLTVDEVDTLADAEAAVAGLAADQGGAIVVHDSVAFSPRVLKHFLAAHASSSTPALCAALPAAVSTRRLSHIGGLTAVTLPSGEAFTAPLYALARGARTADAEPALLPFEERIIEFPVPVGMTGESSARFAMSDSWMCRIDHWVHVQRVNMTALASRWIERGRTGRGKLWFLWRALLGFPWRGSRVLTAVRDVHPKAKVHHTAHVSLSIIEEGADIGARAIINGSYICKGARIEPGAHVDACVVGPGATVSSLAAARTSVLYPRSYAAQIGMQLSVLGEGSVAFSGSFIQDLNFLGNVRVLHRGQTVDVGDRFIGAALGPFARVAGAIWIAAGREIPAGALVVMNPAGVITRTNEELMRQQIVTVDGGKLQPLGPIPPNRPAGDKALPAAAPAQLPATTSATSGDASSEPARAPAAARSPVTA